MLCCSGKRVISSINSAELIAFKEKKIKLPWPLLQTTQKISPRLIVDLNVKVKTDENIGEHLYKLEVDRYFLNRTQKVLTKKEKLNRVIY